MCQAVLPVYECGHINYFEVQLINCSYRMDQNKNICIQEVMRSQGRFVGRVCDFCFPRIFDAMGQCPKCRGEGVGCSINGVVRLSKTVDMGWREGWLRKMVSGENVKSLAVMEGFWNQYWK